MKNVALPLMTILLATAMTAAVAPARASDEEFASEVARVAEQVKKTVSENRQRAVSRPATRGDRPSGPAALMLTAQERGMSIAMLGNRSPAPSRTSRSSARTACQGTCSCPSATRRAA